MNHKRKSTCAVSNIPLLGSFLESAIGGVVPGSVPPRTFAKGSQMLDYFIAANREEIYARNLPERGCIFTVDLPRLPVPAVVMGQRGKSGESRAASSARANL
jgi:hypothetical protein